MIEEETLGIASRFLFETTRKVVVAFIKIGDRDVRGRFFLTALLGQSILPLLKVWWAPSSYFGTDGSKTCDLSSQCEGPV